MPRLTKSMNSAPSIFVLKSDLGASGSVALAVSYLGAAGVGANGSNAGVEGAGVYCGYCGAAPAPLMKPKLEEAAG